MATVTGLISGKPEGNQTVTWSNVKTGDTLVSAKIGGYAHTSVQVLGPYGASVAIALHGSNDDASYAVLHDPQGATITATEPGTAEITDVTPVPDVAGNLNNKYFLISSPNIDYYVWFNINSAGHDPALAGKTAVPVAAATNASVAALCTAITSAVPAALTCNNGVTKVTFTAKAKGAHKTVGGAGNSAFTFTVTTPGVDGTRVVTAAQEAPGYMKPVVTGATIDTNVTVLLNCTK